MPYSIVSPSNKKQTQGKMNVSNLNQAVEESNPLPRVTKEIRNTAKVK